MTEGRRTDSSSELAAAHGIPPAIATTALMTYRSAGIGVFGATMRLLGMPLEKIALYMNSSQVSGKGPFRQAVALTFRQGYLAPYRVVGPSSITAWFLQYSIMGVAFQFFDQALSQALGVEPVWYGPQLMEPPPKQQQQQQQQQQGSSLEYQVRFIVARLASPVMAAGLESCVSNRAEVQRYFGPTKFAKLMTTIATTSPNGGASSLIMTRAVGPAFAPNMMRNIIMCQTSFLLTPMTYRLYMPQEFKTKSSLFWYGLAINMFVGNVAAITQQAFWGRSLDYLAQNHGRISYVQVIRQGLQQEGLAAFFTFPKWSSRVLMNAPAQGTLPWFYNEVLPLGEEAFLGALGAAMPLADSITTYSKQYKLLLTDLSLEVADKSLQCATTSLVNTATSSQSESRSP